MEKNISNKTMTQSVIKKYNFAFKKSLGQNFLVDPNILDKIADSADINDSTGVIEIGPGIGALTQKLAERAGKVVAIEIDQRLIPILNETLAEYQNIKVINADVLKTSIDSIIKNELSGFSSIKVVANLPYYVTSPILIKILTEKTKVDSITVMIQKEVAERITAKPGGKDYGSLTVLVNYYAEANIIFSVPSTVFIPKPNVDSAVIQLKVRKNPPIKIVDEEFFFKVVRVAFQHRRKTLFNNLIHGLIEKGKKQQLEQLFSEINIDPKRRAETFNLDEFAILTNYLEKLLND
ncbi:16S rRNA (adenine(1518)-N(6)/adenine(1519)-N(6))-dimethyltransferase [Vulcanibacillus modesticaldus]|uniref:Ribosomal RNA small subunit methyltransferase A n=1 Tax=Vulcanibacillus modesticaldus TaxID=337097 RepID=A0A1D2YXB1_9BACI|nr:16S rRNA (adenine(1518)-N(6)/adenine(1519)-N(6))-dimethyltransferase RsmA [Vulcanibacillus modesticaldus]OEG00283.1 16S rRNA (adenine(1518)-N(6)/adenine(1519)-N(6))-dimethyltransferase [Vulcanibacillus modesticaldus]